MSHQQERNGTKFVFATVGARTERGGCVTSGSDIRIGGLPLACVGDIVTYSDGSEAVIMDGAEVLVSFATSPPRSSAAASAMAIASLRPSGRGAEYS
jgi:hypothetical protein